MVWYVGSLRDVFRSSISEDRICQRVWSQSEYIDCYSQKGGYSEVNRFDS